MISGFFEITKKEQFASSFLGDVGVPAISPLVWTFAWNSQAGNFWFPRVSQCLVPVPATHHLVEQILGVRLAKRRFDDAARNYNSLEIQYGDWFHFPRSNASEMVVLAVFQSQQPRCPDDALRGRN